MGFIDSYKHLEKLCGDMLQTQHGVSAYIAEMESTPNGSYRVQGWVEDLKCLKHYRWVRNQIVHDPNSSEENIFFIAETKGTMESLELRPIEQAKISCAKKLFNEMSTSNVVYHDVDSYQSLLNIMNSL